MRARLLLGEALSQAGGVSHAYGEWQTVVAPDAAHPGLRVRQCGNCGTHESQPVPPLQVPPRLVPGNVSVSDGEIALDASILSNRWAYAVCTNLVALPVLWTQVSAPVNGTGGTDAITFPFPDSPAGFIRLQPVAAE